MKRNVTIKSILYKEKRRARAKKDLKKKKSSYIECIMSCLDGGEIVFTDIWKHCGFSRRILSQLLNELVDDGVLDLFLCPHSSKRYFSLHGTSDRVAEVERKKAEKANKDAEKASRDDILSLWLVRKDDIHSAHPAPLWLTRI